MTCMGGAQLAIDTITVDTRRFSQAGCRQHGRRAHTRSWQGWVTGPRLSSSSLLRLAVVGHSSCYLWHPPKPSLHRICSSRSRKLAGFTGGVACGAPRPNPAPCRCWMVRSAGVGGSTPCVRGYAPWSRGARDSTVVLCGVCCLLLLWLWFVLVV